MTPLKVSIAGAIASLLFLLVIFELIRSRRLRERYALLWLASGVVLLALSLWRGGLNTIAGWVGVETYPPAVLFAVGVVFILAVLLHYSTVISRLSDQNTILAQRLALLEERLGRESPTLTCARSPAVWCSKRVLPALSSAACRGDARRAPHLGTSGRPRSLPALRGARASSARRSARGRPARLLPDDLGAGDGNRARRTLPPPVGSARSSSRRQARRGVRGLRGGSSGGRARSPGRRPRTCPHGRGGVITIRSPPMRSACSSATTATR